MIEKYKKIIPGCVPLTDDDLCKVSGGDDYDPNPLIDEFSQFPGCRTERLTYDKAIFYCVKCGMMVETIDTKWDLPWEIDATRESMTFHFTKVCGS